MGVTGVIVQTHPVVLVPEAEMRTAAAFKKGPGLFQWLAREGLPETEVT